MLENIWQTTVNFILNIFSQIRFTVLPGIQSKVSEWVFKVSDYFSNLSFDRPSDYLPIVLLVLGIVLLVLCIVLICVQRRAKKHGHAKTAKTAKRGKASAASAALPQQEVLEDERCRRLEEIIHVQEQQISSMQLQIDKAAKLRHDFRQELLVLQEFARSGDREELERYLPQVKLDGSAASIPICPNPLINAVLQFYFNKARAAGIEVDAAIEADEDLWLTAGDVGVLFGNLLENAVTAAAEAPAEARRLRLRTTQTKDCFVIAMGNTFGSPRTLEKNGAFSSTKPEHQGIGLGSIRAVALNYDGEAKFVLDGDMFMSYVILLRPDPS